MTKPASNSKTARKQYTPEFRDEALKLAERIGVAAAVRELILYESQLYNWRSKLKMHIHLPNVYKKCPSKLPASSDNWLSGMKNWPFSKRPRHTSRSA